ncbi:alpha/beta fold hydrolase [Capillimicrobium parvum]|uniref:Poly(3-hydroxyalkanoate) polymerase subunit PhaC n=1 Tax=Capillimicrobium parvum TaxID=2884022 RepID=A0A9E6XSU2_9ACTN|nr:alpha/beta fold hydrolase [Capillimicrobium parvum]UGS33977.1 Poly(3-hydroxyalkanoate) polymerase subunit PhaC [Capillimicrobium parvum]
MSIAYDIRREVERNVVRARNGIKYASGTEWAPEHASPRELVWSQGKARLWRLRSDRVTMGPPVLMFIGLVSLPHILDLHEKSTLAGALRDAGFDVYILDWGAADEGDAQNTLETYLVRYLPRAVRALLRESQCDDVTLLGYCMGGCFALVAVGGQVSIPLRNLVIFATPVDFSQMGGLVEALRDGEIDPESMVDWTGNVPPHIVSSFFRIRKPTVELVQYANLWENLWSDEFLSSYQAMARWASTHVPVPGALFRQVLKGWLYDNGFANGTLRLAGRRVDLANIDVPMLSVVAMRDDIVPPPAALPLGSLVDVPEFELFEVPAGHAGLAGSRKAVHVTFPGVVDWLRRHSDTREPHQ